MDRRRAIELLDSLREAVSDKDILEYIVYNYLSGSDAYEALESTAEEYNLPVGQDDESDLYAELKRPLF